MTDKYKLITRSDFDGVTCAVLLSELGVIDEIEFVHPKEMQAGNVDVTARNITANLPYVPRVHLAFDHHSSEVTRVGYPDNCIIDPDAPSTARVVYAHYGGAERFPTGSEALMTAVDKFGSAQFTQDDVLRPEGWVLLSFLMDARSGLGRFHEFRISNKTLMRDLIDLIRTKPIEEVLAHPDVAERVDLYKQHEAPHADQIRRCARVHANLVVVDLRDEETIYAGNRFVVYGLFPEQNISLHTMWGKKRQNIVFACGKSIHKRDSKTNVGELMLGYGGGGHQAAGSCQVLAESAKRVLAELIERITASG
jgi:nanoRNase/pAp phosphatase (c-di-AMP/oligoRNAs hydrolase)